MKKAIIIVFAVVLVAAAAIGGTAFAVRDNRTTNKQADTTINNWFYDTEASYSSVENAEPREGYGNAMKELELRCLEITKTQGYTSQERRLEDFNDNRGVFYDFLIECCEVYNNTDIQLSDEDVSTLKLFLHKMYYTISKDDMMPKSMISDFESIRAKRDATMQTIFATGAPKYGAVQQ